MERWHALASNWALTISLALIVALNLTCSYYGFSLGAKVMALTLIPILSMLYFRQKKIMANIFVVIFMLYFFGMIFNIMDNFSLSKKLSEAFYTGAYLLLIFVLMGKLKEVKLNGLLSWYLVVVFLINTYLIFQLFTVFKESFQDSVIFTLAVIKGVALLVMAFLAFTFYLSKESKQSIIFLTFLCCFVFSDMLSFITTSYLYFWLFEAAQKIFQGLGLILAFAYVSNHQAQTVKINAGKNFKHCVQSGPMGVQS